LERLLGLLVRELTADVFQALRVCRLCDRGACASGGTGCPLTDPEARRGRDG
jgi:hypothetical protein